MPVSSLLRILNPRALGRIVQMPMRSIYPQRADPDRMADFMRTLLRSDLDPTRDAKRILDFATDDPAQYDRRLHDAMSGLAQSAVDDHLRRFGPDTSRWGAEALGSVYTASVDPGGGGHAAYVVSLEPHDDAAGFLRDRNLPRSYLQAFPGGAFAASVPQYLEIFRGAVDGVDAEADVLQRLLPDVRAYNADLWRRAADVLGPHRLGGNSTVVPARTTRVYGPDGDMQSVLMATALDHSQDGIVPWTFLRRPEFPGGVVCVSVHLGDNPVWGGNAVNVAIAPPLFKTIFRRGTLLARFVPELVARYGADRAAALLLDPEIRETFEEHVRQADFRVASDTAVLAAMDAVGGPVFRRLRFYFGADVVATVDASRVEEVSTSDEYDAMIRDGVARSQTQGYDGPPTVVPAPGDVVVDPAAVASGVSVGPVSPRDTPLAIDVSGPAEALDRIAGGLDWDYLRRAADEDVASAVREAIDQLPDPASRSAADLAKAVDTPELRAKARDALCGRILAALAGQERFQEIVEAVGDGGAEPLAGIVVSDPLWDRMTQAAQGDSYLDASVRAAASAELLHLLTEAKGELEKRLADSARQVEETKGEVDAKRRALDEIERELKDKPGDPDLERKRKSIQSELEDLEARERDAEETHRKDEDAAEKREADAKAAEAADDAAARERDAHAHDVFHGDARTLALRRLLRRPRGASRAGGPLYSEPGEAALLLSQQDERLQYVKIGKATIILSAYDSLALGPGETDWRGKDFDGKLALFAEDLLLGANLAAAGGIVSARSLTGPQGGPATIDATGVAGATPPAAPGTPPVDGDPGDPGGSLGVYLETVDPDVAPLRILTAGGQGGGGQPGDSTKDGGNGGPGGDGGRVDALVLHPAMRSIDALRSAYQLGDLGAKRAAVKAAAEAMRNLYADVARALDAACADGVTRDDLDSAIDDAGLTLMASVNIWKARFRAAIDVSGGAGGTYGIGRHDGRPGDAGKDGVETLTCAGDPADASGDTAPFFRVHPSQCAMTLEKAKLALLFADPLRHPEEVRDAAVLFERIRARTAPFVGLDPKSKLAQAYADNEAAYGAFESIAALQSLNAEASTYLSYMKNGLDFFGYTSDYVPLTSLRALTDDGVTPVLDAFTAIEAAYNKRFADLKDDKATLDVVDAARRQALALAAQANVDAPQLLAALTADATIIDGYQQVLPAKKTRVDDALAKYQDAVRKSFSFDWGQLIGAIGQIAFAPEAPLMYVTQAATILYGSGTEVQTIDGQHVRKDFIVHQIQAAGDDVDALIEGVKVLNDGSLAEDDPGADKLLADVGKLEALMDSLYGQFPAETQELVAAIQDYVGTVTARNTQVLAYNAALTLLYRAAQQQDAARAQAESLQTQALASLALDAPALTAFVSQAYYRARSQVLLLMDLASRAYRFWALDDSDLLRDSLGGTAPPDIDSVVLQSIQAGFWAKYANALGQVGSGQVFPADPHARRGETFVVKGVALEIFKTTRQLMVQVPPARRDTTQGPFVDMSNVRITAVRVYVNGAKTNDGRIVMTVRHTGPEQLVSPDDVLYRFRHPPVPRTFKYVLATEEIIEDATFEVPGSEDLRNLALLGPCTTWYVSVDPGQNPGLDLSDVTEIEIDFRGYSWGFN